MPRKVGCAWGRRVVKLAHDMRILFRYVLREFLVPLFYCLAGFLSIYVLFELFNSFGRIANAHPPFAKVALYFAGYLAPYFEWLAPACLMLAALYTMWSFCRHSELIAMRASGIGFMTIVTPMLLVALVVTGAVYWVNESFVPRYGQWARNFRLVKFDETEMAAQDKVVFRNTSGRRTWHIGLVVNDTATVLEDVSVKQDRENGTRELNLSAPRAEYLDGEWWFSNPVVQYFDERGRETADPSPELSKLTLRVVPSIDEKPRDFLIQNRDWAYGSVGDRIRYLQTYGSLEESTRTSYRYDIWAKAVSPLACLVITLFAIPAGVATGRQSVFKGVVGALGMFFAFYALTIGFMVVSKQGYCPAPVAALTPDVVFLAAGLYMMHRQR